MKTVHFGSKGVPSNVESTQFDAKMVYVHEKLTKLRKYINNYRRKSKKTRNVKTYG